MFGFRNKSSVVNGTVRHMRETAKGRRDISSMGQKRERHQPAFMVTHSVVNKLSVIMGNCELLIEIAEKDTEVARRLAVIRDVADAAVKELTRHQPLVDEETRTSERRKAG